MGNHPAFGVLWWWTGAELLALFVLFGLVSASLSGFSSVFSSYPQSLRLAALVFLTIELLIPIWVYSDLRQRSDSPGSFWVHVAAMPGINLFGLIAYLQERKQ